MPTAPAPRAARPPPAPRRRRRPAEHVQGHPVLARGHCSDLAVRAAAMGLCDSTSTSAAAAPLPRVLVRFRLLALLLLLLLLHLHLLHGLDTLRRRLLHVRPRAGRALKPLHERLSPLPQCLNLLLLLVRVRNLDVLEHGRVCPQLDAGLAIHSLPPAHVLAPSAAPAPALASPPTARRRPRASASVPVAVAIAVHARISPAPRAVWPPPRYLSR